LVMARDMSILGKIFGKQFSKRDRVRYCRRDWPARYGPQQTGFSDEILVDYGKEGTIVDSGRSMATVRWDSGSYRIYKDIVLDSPGNLKVVDKGSANINSFTAQIRTSLIEEIG